MRLAASIVAAFALFGSETASAQTAFVDAAVVDKLWEAIGARCKNDEPRLAQCIIVLTPTDCAQVKGRRLPYLSNKIVKVNEDKTVMLHGSPAPVPVSGLLETTYNADGVQVKYGQPQIVMWQEFKRGRKVSACEREAKLDGDDFKLPRN